MLVRLLCFVNTAASGGLKLLAGSTHFTGKAVGWGECLPNLGAEEFSAWMVANSNSGAGCVLGSA